MPTAPEPRPTQDPAGKPDPPGDPQSLPLAIALTPEGPALYRAIFSPLRRFMRPPPSEGPC